MVPQDIKQEEEDLKRVKQESDDNDEEMDDANLSLLGGKTIHAGMILNIKFLNAEINYQMQKVMRESLPKSPTQETLPEFPWNDRWLRGYEYEYILNNYQMYCEKYGFAVYTKNHDLHIYSKPKNGEMYFLEKLHLRQFGFPRIDNFDKKIKWKKMNFTTNLPKIDPQVKYLVASGKLGSQCFRMHVVVLAHEFSRNDTLSQVNVKSLLNLLF